MLKELLKGALERNFWKELFKGKELSKGNLKELLKGNLKELLKWGLKELLKGILKERLKGN